MDSVEVVIVGAGVIGLACARALSKIGKEVIVIERHASFGSETSSRNSEVIHAGIYYPLGSKKQSLCVEGRIQLYQFCQEYNISHKMCGKLIVATNPQQERQLNELYNKGINNGVTDLQRLTAEEAQRLEPELQCVAALLSPSTGIISSYEFMHTLLGDAQDKGASLALKTNFISARADETGFELQLSDPNPIQLRSKILINAAGLNAPNIARKIQGLAARFIPNAYYAKGNYFSLTGASPFSRLIYPLPEAGGLGIHLTLDLAGRAKFGPDVVWMDEINYDVDQKNIEKFYSAIRNYWPKLKDESLYPAFAGIRPKIVSKGDPDADFLIQGSKTHGVFGLVNLFGIESPGLTSSLAIADEVTRQLTASLL